MRNKFSELVAAGVAPFHQEARTENGTQCPMCRFYNNIWGMPTDTHMSNTADGRTILTGRLTQDPEKWTKFKYGRFWGGIDFAQSGFYSLAEWLQSLGKECVVTTVNGDQGFEIVDCNCCKCACPEVGQCTTTESKIPVPLRSIEIIPGSIKEILESTTDRSEMVRKLNHSSQVKGNNWVITDECLTVNINGLTYLIETKWDKGTRIEAPELYAELEKMGLGDLYLVQFPRYIVIASDDKKWAALLSKDEQNKIFATTWTKMSVEQWIDEIQYVISTYN